MKIGILTLPLHTNYGGILQAYALKKVLESKGHEVWLIDTKFNKVPPKKVFTRFLKTFLHRIQGKTSILFPLRLRNKAYRTYTKPFIDKHIVKITKKFDDPNKIGLEIKTYNFDAYVVGSDQIWNPKYFPNIEIAFFSFLNGKDEIKISYAPSFGADTWNYKPEKSILCKELIDKFHAISVREDLGQDFCLEFFGKKAELVLDPTLLLTRDHYISLIEQRKSTYKKGGLFTYVLDLNEEKRKIINDVSSFHNLTPYQLEIIEGHENTPLEWRTKAEVEDWIINFHNADFIVTDSFHGTVFSILFNKPFFSLINYDRGGVRFKSILKQFDLLGRMIGAYTELNESVLSNQINWEKVNNTLEEKRNKSSIFLENALNPESRNNDV